MGEGLAAAHTPGSAAARMEAKAAAKSVMPAKAGGQVVRSATGLMPKLKPLGKGSTGRIKPKNLHEQLVMQEAMANPSIGTPIDIKKGMTDPRWPKDGGWEKRSWYNNGIEVHYVVQIKDNIINAVDDFKFKK